MQPCSEGLSQPKRQQLQGATEGLAEDRKIDFRGQGRKRTTLDEEAHDFWVRVHKAGKDECWPWLGGRNGNEHPHKYGVFKFQGKKQFAHDVACIKHLYKTGRLRQFAIARVFELTGSQVSHIVSGRNWKHVTQVEDEGGS